MKKVIFVWTINPYPCNMKYSAGHNFWGIGDIIRGMISTEEICKKKNIEFYIDVFNHPISKYLSISNYKYKDYVKKNIDKVYWVGNNIDDYISKWSDDNPMLIMTNTLFKEKVISEKSIILEIFNKNYIVTDYINNFKMEKNINKGYSILHFRLGDDKLVRNMNDTTNFEAYYNLYTKHLNENQIFICDNIEFRKFIKLKHHDAILIETNNLIHFGYNTINIDDKIKETVIEFFLVLECNSIKSKGCYGRPSGFVLYPSILKNIPLEVIN